ncbi:hypothetical protein AXF42_Ash000571 [Apostasia shenzhenica]|uniref:Protein JASON n=1 Tax=Apostasia shenzhenica TaxID=1088818 RepID=A0A2I0AGW5_9ASPA|nr:hypothetical protein AXF42_Ash000571 [Apostasia shenzhenica]
MGCFLGCFRSNDDRCRKVHISCKAFYWKKREPVVPRKQCASVFSSEEKDTPCKNETKEFQEGFERHEDVHQEMRNEVELLKSCGALTKTPAEIPKKSDPPLVISNTSCRKISWDETIHESFNHPSFIDEEHEREEDFNPINIVVNEEVKRSGAEEELDSTTSDILPFHTQNQLPQFSITESPLPTPLHLADGIQTPGTIYGSMSQDFRFGKIRTEFVYPVTEPSHNIFPSEVSREDIHFSHSSCLSEQKDCKNAPKFSLCQETPASDETKTTLDGTEEFSHSGKSPDVDRPIIGAVAAHWNEVVPSRVPSKPWDGKGIPNSTTKYKEDQKVSWHATPFEVRLEKALSDEKLYPHRKLAGRLIKDDEDEQSNSATPKQDSPPLYK